MLLSRRQYFVKEHPGVFKLTDRYDIIDPESGQPIGLAREEPSSWAKFARLLIKKRLLPTVIQIYEHEAAPPVLSLRKKPGFLHSTVLVSNSQQAPLGRFRSKFFSIGGGFHVYDAAGQQVAEIKGDWKGWNFRFLGVDGRELGVVTKKWAGIGKELFTTADNYMISLSEQTAGIPDRAALLLAAGLAIDIVFKEA